MSIKRKPHKRGSQTQRPELRLTGALESMLAREDVWGSSSLPPRISHREGPTQTLWESTRAATCYSVSALPRWVGKAAFFLRPPTSGV